MNNQKNDLNAVHLFALDKLREYGIIPTSEEIEDIKNVGKFEFYKMIELVNEIKVNHSTLYVDKDLAIEIGKVKIREVL